MLVYDMFEGDDMKLAWGQHDAYGQALGLIIDGCRAHFLAACLVGGGDRERWPVDISIDHRTLQDAHDLAAGAWRWRMGLSQRTLSLDKEPAPKPDTISWLHWLGSEVESWWAEPRLILSVVAIVTHQNSTIGYAGERPVRRLDTAMV